jgi:hypothetical protein
LKSKEKIVSVYLGEHSQLVTVGSYGERFMREGLGSLRRIKMEQDEKQGKLPAIQAVIFDNGDI